MVTIRRVHLQRTAKYFAYFVSKHLRLQYFFLNMAGELLKSMTSKRETTGYRQKTCI